MTCDKCGNYKPHADRIWHGDKCQNFKPKPHPLDKLIEEFIKEKPYSITDFREQAKKLRYESIKYGATIPANYGTYDADAGLRADGKGDWICGEGS